MFKELGALIDAAGEAAAKSLRISAKAVKEALSGEDKEVETLGILSPGKMPNYLPKYHGRKKQYIKGIYDKKQDSVTIITDEDE